MSQKNIDILYSVNELQFLKNAPLDFGAILPYVQTKIRKTTVIFIHQSSFFFGAHLRSLRLNSCLVVQRGQGKESNHFFFVIKKRSLAR